MNNTKNIGDTPLEVFAAVASVANLLCSSDKPAAYFVSGTRHTDKLPTGDAVAQKQHAPKHPINPFHDLNACAPVNELISVKTC